MAQAKPILPPGFDFIHNIPEGFYGPSVLAYDEKQGCNVIIKSILKRGIGDHDKIRDFLTKVKTIQSISSPCIVQYSEILESDIYIFLVRRFIDGLTLYSYIVEGIVQDRNIVFALWKVIVRTIQHLHQYNIFSIFIKPSSIFVVDRKHILITDLLPIPSQHNPHFHRSDTYDFALMSPELFTHQFPISEKSDVWSLGILLHFMMTQQLPFSSTNIVKMRNCIKMSEVILNEDLPFGVEPILKEMFKKDPNERPKTDFLLNQNPGLQGSYKKEEVVLKPIRFAASAMKLGLSNPNSSLINKFKSPHSSLQIPKISMINMGNHDSENSYNLTHPNLNLNLNLPLPINTHVRCRSTASPLPPEMIQNLAQIQSKKILPKLKV